MMTGTAICVAQIWLVSQMVAMINDLGCELPYELVAHHAGEKIVGMTLLRRAGELGDVASACVFLASEEQRYVTGQVISVSGGAYLGS